MNKRTIIVIAGIEGMFSDPYKVTVELSGPYQVERVVVRPAPASSAPIALEFFYPLNIVGDGVKPGDAVADAIAGSIRSKVYDRDECVLTALDDPLFASFFVTEKARLPALVEYAIKHPKKVAAAIDELSEVDLDAYSDGEQEHAMWVAEQLRPALIEGAKRKVLRGVAEQKATKAAKTA